MVYIVSIVYFPGHKAPEVARAGFQAQKKYPEDEPVAPYFRIWPSVATLKQFDMNSLGLCF